MAQFFVSMRRRRDPTEVEAFPWCVPALRNLTQLELRAPITFLAGENGSGKSTLLEAMAIGLNAVAVGSTDLSKDVSLATSLEFAKHYQFQRNGMPKARMFFRAEDVFGFCKRVITELEEFHKLKEEFRESLAEGSKRPDRSDGAGRKTAGNASCSLWS